MNDAELEKILKATPVPERPDEYWEKFPGRVMAKLPRAPVARRYERAWRPQLAWGLGIACACLAIGFALGHWRGRNEADPFALLGNEKMLREVLTLFPNRVRAIEQDERGLQLVLSDKPDVPVSRPLWIKICSRQGCRAVVTFSGQELQFAGEKLEVLVDAQGQVLLVGERFVWSSAEPERVPRDLRIQARQLAYAM